MCLLFRKITDIPLIFNNIIQNQDYIRKTFMQKGQPFLTVLTDLQIHFQFLYLLVFPRLVWLFF